MASASSLTEDEVEDIYLGALEVLERAGLKVQDPDCIDIFADAGCKVDRETHIVRFPPEVVEDAVNVSPARIRLCGRDPKKRCDLGSRQHPTFTPFLEGVLTVDLETKRSGSLPSRTSQTSAVWWSSCLSSICHVWQ